jgi:hypothetical protein
LLAANQTLIASIKTRQPVLIPFFFPDEGSAAIAANITPPLSKYLRHDESGRLLTANSHYVVPRHRSTTKPKTNQKQNNSSNQLFLSFLF